MGIVNNILAGEHQLKYYSKEVKTLPARFTDAAITERMQDLLNGPYLSELTSADELLEFLKGFRDELLQGKLNNGVREMARMGAAARNKSMTAEQRSRSARKAALARWAKRKRRRPDLRK